MSHRDAQYTPRRSRSPKLDRHSRSTNSYHDTSSHSKRKRSPPSLLTILPLHAARLSKHDYATYKPMFGLYLDIQKQLVLEDLSEDEVRGRWKSFVGKWNRGELAEGWYDPSTLRKALALAISSPTATTSCHTRNQKQSKQTEAEQDVETSDDDLVGPSLPNTDVSARTTATKRGPTIANLQDLELQRELANEDSIERREILRQTRALERKQEKERLEELAPRADAGSKDRMLEKKREKADSNRAFAASKTETGGVEEVRESDLLGDEEGGIEGFKKQKREMDRKKNDREIRKEELLRARQEEREQRVKEYKAKEEKTMSGLVALAKARFG
ncbi:hypothetical protein MMC12_008670 [Toensbergia leucococca]|nr:hypothetical protein [Toensbergia leucococca]